MTTDEAKRCLPGRRVYDWALGEAGTVSELRVRDDSVWLMVRYDDSSIITYQDDETEYLDAL